MSKIFYDNHIKLEKLDSKIKEIVDSEEERIEFWHLIDEMVHHRVMGCIFDKLSGNHHKEFIDKYHKKPYDESIFSFLLEKIGEDIKDFIKKEVVMLEYELLKQFKIDEVPSIKKTKTKLLKEK